MHSNADGGELCRLRDTKEIKGEKETLYNMKKKQYLNIHIYQVKKKNLTVYILILLFPLVKLFKTVI